MTLAEYRKKQEREEAFLDTKDLRPFLKKDKNIYTIMEEIEDVFDDYVEEPLIFNCMDHGEFIDYLQNRYPDINFYEYIEYRVL